MELNALLWKVFNNYKEKINYPLPRDGRVSFLSEKNMPDSYWYSIGYYCINKFAFRIDVFERVFFLARQKIKYGPFIESSDLMNPIGCNSSQLQSILNICGFGCSNLSDDKKLFYYKVKKLSSKIKKNNKSDKKIIKIINKKININNKPKIIKENNIDPNSPFAVLGKLL